MTPESTDKDPWGITECRGPVRVDLGPLQLCYGCVAWRSCEIPNSGSKGSF